jgi:hypothetical protein
MNEQHTLHSSVLILCLVILITLGLSGCQSASEEPPPIVETQIIQATQPKEPGQSDVTAIPAVPTSTAAVAEPDPAAIQVAWESSPHADTFILDANGQNNTCARCHAPINWLPAMEDLPESCFACKFELEPPPPTIAEGEWVDVPCKICHRVDKKDNVQPEVVWLEIAPLDEYIAVTSPSELCLKCHAAADLPGHTTVEVGGAHPRYECTKCHSAHDTKASCDTPGCHVEPTSPIPGHDTDHQTVSCVACHDGSGMEVGPDDVTSTWTTFITRSTEGGEERFAFTSHQVVLEAKCDRCHFASNPWGLTESVVVP